jgi:RNA-directed DNA polymerase
LEANLPKLAGALRASTYQPRPVRRVWIEKLGKRHEKRPLGIPTIRARVVPTALRNVLEPIYEKDFAARSYGFRPGRGCKDALRRVVELLAAGYTWVVDADLKSYFDTIPHGPLLERVREKVRDGRILDLVSAYLQQPVMESHKQWTPQGGSPQGAVLSPLLSNIYLHPLDHLMATEGHEMVRYADDFVILCRSEAEAQRALERVQQWTARAGLTVHSEKTRIVEASLGEGFEFLGYQFKHGQQRPRKKSVQKLKHTLRAKTKRTSGIGLSLIIENVNRTLPGWFEYFKHSHRDTFPRLDSWVRMRLRSILRKRQGLKGRGRGRDHSRWPNAFFVQHGLFSLTTAHAIACQSSRR